MVEGGTASLSLLDGWKLFIIFIIFDAVRGITGGDGDLHGTNLCLKLAWLASAFEGTSAECTVSGCRGACNVRHPA